MPETKTFTNETQHIRELYLLGWSSRKIANELKCSKTPILKAVKDIVRPHSFRKYKPNETVFNDLDDCNAWYWAGYIAADGNISYKKQSPNSNPIINIVSQAADVSHLKNFTSWINLNKSVTVNKDKNFCFIEFASSKMANDLQAIWNITPAKSFTIRIPKIKNSKYMSHYIRGVFDGDGCICCKSNASKNKVSNPACESNITTASIGFLEDLISVCPKYSSLSLDKRNNVRRIRWHNFEDVFTFMEWIYSGSDKNNRLERKYEKWNYIKSLSSRF